MKESWVALLISLTPTLIYILVKLNTRTSSDYYARFNRRSGIKQGTKEAGNQVTVVEQGGEGGSYAKLPLSLPS